METKRASFTIVTECSKKRKIEKKVKKDDSVCGRKLYIIIGNCVARKVLPNSIVDRLSQKYEYANPYAERTEGPYPNLAAPSHRATLGSIEVRMPPEDRKDDPFIVVLYSQYRMGSVSSEYYMCCPGIDKEYKTYSTEKDSLRHRQRYLRDCLDTLCELLNDDRYRSVEEIIFPRAHKNEWYSYQDMIDNFIEKANAVSVPPNRFRISISDYE